MMKLSTFLALLCLLSTSYVALILSQSDAAVGVGAETESVETPELAPSLLLESVVKGDLDGIDK